MYSLSSILLIHQFDLKKIRKKTLYRRLEFVFNFEKFSTNSEQKIFL